MKLSETEVKRENFLSPRKIGIHVSISGKIERSFDRASSLGCVGAFQIFTCSPRRWDATNLKKTDVEAFRLILGKGKFDVFAHMPYLPNLCSPDSKIYSRSIAVLTRELERCSDLGIENLVVHFGSLIHSSQDEGRKKIASACKLAIRKTSGAKVRLLLENSADSKSIGSRFADIRKVLDEIDEGSDRTGVCLDTCHAFAAGYDVRDERSVSKTADEFDSEIGLEFLHLIHLNDSKGEMGEGRDRHENIGKGRIGSNGLSAILTSERLVNIPAILETPIDREGDDRRNLDAAKRLAGIS